MQVLADLGLLDKAEYIPSPNADLRPDEADLSLIVVHGISLPPNHFGGPEVEQLFTNQLDPKADPYFEMIKDLRVSAHLFIRRDGSIIQFVPFHKRAWHAGVSDFNGRPKCNDFSIGIELEGTDHTLYTAIQYESLAASIKAIWKAYPQIPKTAVVGHCDIAPNRKTDPGRYFLWSALRRMLESA
ncbi:1,6-anhydro-N-acetylmuramyl-L-alanine amidase AmpD [Thiomicrorhabdus sp. 6S2-11]|uniref:1,6-anhydro-N-acetylmuramyl-L-alanine amidase AmpD n=1 Tax=Thiomicrorhabdus marina TaxID=2818442 RepID=A0ABS3Q0Z1_9GAMM|nr:1,6-anhydro-N-acetylmuramyl-L-alanine amidase AmpD [Thiomicrorhabdus marina]MBO1925982.1 1,6-anhydro-N-acetylmuramyl-L-alanine amidase AmpD [Thiomicrorhabdus marina]